MKKLTAKQREVQGKKVKSLRAEGQLPAVVFGPLMDSTNIIIGAGDFDDVFEKAGYSKLIDFEMDGVKGSSQVLVREVQRDVLTQQPLHVSLYQVDPKSEITTDVPLELTGESPAVNKNVGPLVQGMDTVLVRCLPADLPASLTVDISGLEAIGDSFSLSDIELPKGVEFDPNLELSTSVVFIAAPQKQILVEEETEGDDEVVDAAEVGDEEAGEGEEGEATAEEAEGAEPASE